MGSAARAPGRAGWAAERGRAAAPGFRGLLRGCTSAQGRGQPCRALPLQPCQPLPHPLHPAGVSAPPASPCAAPAPARSPPRRPPARRSGSAREAFARRPDLATIS